MSDATQVRIQQLMAQGLDFYAIGEDERAVECWQQVLDLDPDHGEAQDYLRTARDHGDEHAADAPAAPPPGTGGSLVEEAIALFGRGETEEALQLLETLGRAEVGSLEVEGWIDQARAVLWREYQRRLCDGIAVPQLRVRQDDVTRYNLPPEAGFVLSRIDGSTSVNDILELAGRDPFQMLQICCRLIDAGIVEVHP